LSQKLDHEPTAEEIAAQSIRYTSRRCQ
ncbi:sigma-70 region 3 family protein, partial [Vibrio parahaemolyticus V-223/04]